MREVKMETIGERIRHIRGEMDLGFLADKLGVHKNTLSNYERGIRIPDANMLGRLLEIFPSANPGWLLTGEGAKELLEGEKAPEGFFLVPFHELSLKGPGGERIVSKQVINYVSFDTNWVRNFLGVPPQDLALIAVKGDNMEPSLSDGDLVLVDLRGKGVEDNGIYVLQFKDTLLVRRLHRKLDGSVLVKSDNTVYDTEFFSEDDAEALKVVGRVIWTGRKT
jgi:phage repressor protein C with HTH and peptisase S24 domain